MKINTSILSMSLILLAGFFTLSSCEKDQLIEPRNSENLTNGGPTTMQSTKRTTFYGLTSSNEIVRLSSVNAAVDQDAVALTGLQPGEQILAIDFRPATGQLYGVSSQSRLYSINPITGRSSAISATPFTPAINGTLVGFDFNPTVDRIRLVTENEQNLRLHPETGMVAVIDGDINPGDKNIAAAAYTNSFAGATTTTLYTIDFTERKLYKQNPPNNGTQEEIGSLGNIVTGEGGFDISPDNNIALAVVNGGGDDGSGNDLNSQGKKSNFYFINLVTGQATVAGVSKRNIIGLAIPTNKIAYAVDPDNQLLIFNPDRLNTMIKKAITGLQDGEKVLGIDMRPATGQLYALGSSNRIYTINMASGAAAAVGLTPFSQALNGSFFGFDFNPTVDRIRIVSNKGQNLRVHPVTGAVAFVDGGLNPGLPEVDAAAYTNNFAGATTTTLFVMDYNTDALYTQAPPNDGKLNLIGSLGLDVYKANGFDIGGTSGSAMGIFSTEEDTYLCSINTSTGSATIISSFPDDVRGFAIGLGF
ncbi:MAG TPA: DUF4394 domain-containing protein [Saprospiraceae bacterium]|nr:DUF4394 domain-containing protein [Saprospiraceae bacterium]